MKNDKQPITSIGEYLLLFNSILLYNLYQPVFNKTGIPN